MFWNNKLRKGRKKKILVTENLNVEVHYQYFIDSLKCEKSEAKRILCVNVYLLFYNLKKQSRKKCVVGNPVMKNISYFSYILGIV